MIFNKLKLYTLSLESFFAYIDREFFTPVFPEFQNINLNENSFKWVVLGFYFAFLLSMLAIFYNRVVIGSLPRALIAADCISPESAKTFSELGYKKNPFVAFTLLRGNTLRRVVHCVEGDEWEKDEKNTRRSRFAELFLPEKRYKINFETDRFYIPEKYRDISASRFEKKGNGILPLILSAVGGLLAVVLIMRFSPVLLEFVDGIIGNISQNGNSGIVN